MQRKEKQIWQQIKKGNTDAYKYLFDSYYNELYFFSRKFLAYKEVAEEIVQDAFIALWQNRASININQSLKSYLYTTVKNRSVNYLRSKFNNIRFASLEEADIETNDLTSDKHLELSELDELIKKVIEQLPERCKEIFHLSRNSDLTYQEIADTLLISKETVKSQISEAIRRVKSYLNKNWDNIPLK